MSTLGNKVGFAQFAAVGSVHAVIVQAPDTVDAVTVYWLVPEP